jgi:hypothetical protein
MGIRKVGMRRRRKRGEEDGVEGGGCGWHLVQRRCRLPCGGSGSGGSCARERCSMAAWMQSIAWRQMIRVAWISEFSRGLCTASCSIDTVLWRARLQAASARAGVAASSLLGFAWLAGGFRSCACGHAPGPIEQGGVDFGAGHHLYYWFIGIKRVEG